ncbi:hypothetical protein BDY19DRAFT_723815 [Irpex rosettiformis]|uniref:Uncharacterized protein n=1 Tax=Irpex rosettiformis TaxID=378272 RepID=A0ACB8U8J9_9APHY|nr:hypothetical protein BDY19DRAFT_723815 [Irpex rosettiformis]
MCQAVIASVPQVRLTRRSCMLYDLGENKRNTRSAMLQSPEKRLIVKEGGLPNADGTMKAESYDGSPSQLVGRTVGISENENNPAPSKHSAEFKRLDAQWAHTITAAFAVDLSQVLSSPLLPSTANSHNIFRFARKCACPVSTAQASECIIVRHIS